MATLQIPKITYKDKKDFQTQGQDDEYKICAKDMNEIKSVFNNSAESIEKGLNTIDENVKKTNDARDLAKQYMEQASQDALAINGTANGIIEKVTTEDGYAQINDSSNRRLNNMIIRGNSEQIQTTGKNLLDFNNFKNVSVEKGTKVNTTDNSITIKATENDCYTRYPYEFIKVEPNTKYTFLVEREGNFTGVCYVFYYSKIYGDILQNVYFDGDSKIFTTPSDCNYISYRVGIDKSGSMNLTPVVNHHLHLNIHKKLKRLMS